MNYQGVIIEESLENKDVLKEVKILSTKVEPVVEKHKTPWVKQWTLHTVEILEHEAETIAQHLSHELESNHAWYADFKNDTTHFIIFKNKVFKIDRKSKEQYDEMRRHGLTVGTPEYQLPNYQDLPKDVLADFLREANKSTYANKDAPKITSTRLKSEDYHFEKDELIYHDTYFGGRDFIGEEIVYKNQKPAWGANYYGFILDENINEKDLYGFLRKALMQDYDSLIPVRGPNKFEDSNWLYAFSVEGDLASFSGQEEILLNGKAVYRCLVHGGFIQ